MSKKLSKDILKHSVIAGLVFAILYSLPVLIDKNGMDHVFNDQTCVDEDGDGVCNLLDDDIDGDDILNQDDDDIDGDGVINDDDKTLLKCDADFSWVHYYAYLLIFIGPIFSVLLYRKKVQNLVYRECFSICFLTLAVGTILGKLMMLFISKSFQFGTDELLETLNAGVFGLVIFAAYSFLLAYFLKKQ